MSGKRKKRGRRLVVDAGAKVAMLAALREGRRLGEVAEGYGVTLQAFYSARRRDPLFAAAWRDAHALSAEAERGLPGRGGETGGEGILVRSNGRRLVERRRMRHVRFDARRKGIFLAHFARSCDLAAAAAAAGICERTVYNHLGRDPAFAQAFRAAIPEAEERREPPPLAGEGVELDRAMKLLARWGRHGPGLPKDAATDRARPSSRA